MPRFKIKKNMKNYNFKKAKQIILENLENLESASLGMHEDCRKNMGKRRI